MAAIKYAPNANKTRETALSWVGDTYPAGWCLRFQAREIFKVPGVGDWDGDKAADAEDYWKAAVARGKVVRTSNPDAIPAGVMIMWTDPNRPDYGHAAYSLGDGWMVSTDLPTSGKVGRVRVSEASRRWGHTLVGYVLIDGNGFTLTPRPKSPPKPSPDSVRWVEARFLNLKGDDTEGARTFGKRAPDMVDDLTRDLDAPGFKTPHAIGVCELRRGEQEKLITGLMGEAGFDKVRVSAGNGLYVPKGTAVRYRGTYTLPKSVQGEGRAEALLRSVATLNGHEAAIGVGHLDFRPGKVMDSRRVEQGKATAGAMIRMGRRFEDRNLEPTHRHIVMIDENSDEWVRDRAFEPAGYTAAVKSGPDAIYVGDGRDVLATVVYGTESDHKVIGVVTGHARHS